MASTFSTTLRLELIGDGDQSGIWGQTTNTNLGSLLEQAITGVVNITMVDANYTLTNFNGVSDEARNVVLVLGGTNAAVRDVITPLVEKLYVVKNSTSGGFAVNIRAASGSSVSVPSGATVWVYCDGTNFNAIGTESVGNFEVNGNLTVTGNTNAVAATYTGNVAALNYSTAGNVAATGNVSAANFVGAGLTITSINASNISAGTISNARTTAASANGASTIVARDTNGSFSANVGTFTSVTGDGASLTNLNASNLTSGTVASARVSGSYTGITGVGTLTAGTWNASTIAVANGGTGVTTSTGTGNVVLSASPALTGTPTAPNAANGTSTTQIATTAFVNAAVTNATSALGTMSTQNANNVTITGGSITGITDLTVADGGTGTSTFTANSVVLGNGTSALNSNMIAPGTSGNVLTSNGTTWTSAVPGPVLGTAQSTTSGTAFNFTGLPSTVKRIIISFNDVSLDGSDFVLVQIGDAGGVETTGYVSTSNNVNDAGGSGASSSTSGYVMRNGGSGTSITGQMTLTNIDGNTWISSHVARFSTIQSLFGGGNKTLSDVLTQVRITRTGSDSFDAGAVNIMYD
jgi:hypothetical protein